LEAGDRRFESTRPDQIAEEEVCVVVRYRRFFAAGGPRRHRLDEISFTSV
jgi:hypothetical protein